MTTIEILRRRTAIIAGKIIKASQKARRTEEHESLEETKSHIIGQNRALLGVLNWIKGGEDVSPHIQRTTTGKEIIRMAQELEHLSKAKSPAQIRACFTLALTHQRQEANQGAREKAKESLMANNVTIEQVNRWVKGAATINNIEN